MLPKEKTCMVIFYVATKQCGLTCRSEKEKTKFQQEVFELMSQIESINKEKVIYSLIFIIRILDDLLEAICAN